ncbi:uncharacterized protein LOC105846942 [Hydra vulgaris]|uniref:uncharacterized protein LOC105846942 n=1 Tax=Hydra vulgaris TaxID=6087 RepID=UPI000640D757|nr:probable assembly chaperone of rpl4 [Hydra vulgaris]XP_047138541.1 probable assembly chaperone of rpl4 [Hydra vulgaris]
MGKRKKIINDQKAGVGSKPQNTGSKQHYSVDDLLNRVNEYIESFEFELAEKFCKKALDLEPQNISALVTFGNICAELGDLDNAKTHFSKAVELDPLNGHVKYLYLGQLSEGNEAVENYKKAILIMKSEIENQKNNASNNIITNKDLSSVYCSLAEIYMTDCCLESDAETLCEGYCKLAIECDSGNIDALLAMSNFLLSKENIVEAESYIKSAYTLWKKLSEEGYENIPDTISYESRISLIKLLIEVASYESVSNITDQLVEENEDDLRIWYYIGLSKFLLKDGDNPRFYLEKALELITKTGTEEDTDIKNHILEMLEDCPLEELDPVDTLQEEDLASDEENEIQMEM